MRVKVKDFASSKGVSASIVYRHIREHREELGDSVIKEPKATWLTDEAQSYISALMVSSPIIVSDAEHLRELEELRAKCDSLRELIDKKDDYIVRILERLENNSEELIQLKEERLRIESESQSLRHELELERNRPLTFSERLTGRKRT